MFFSKSMLIEATNGFDYVIMSVLKVDGIEYAFANKLMNSMPTDEYSIFMYENNNIVMLDDANLMKKLVPEFQKDINEDLGKLLSYINEGDEL